MQSHPHSGWVTMRQQPSISVFLVLIWSHCSDYYKLVVMQLISLPVFLKPQQRPDVFLFCYSELWAQTARPLLSRVRSLSHQIHITWHCEALQIWYIINIKYLLYVFQVFFCGGNWHGDHNNANQSTSLQHIPLSLFLLQGKWGHRWCYSCTECF